MIPNGAVAVASTLHNAGYDTFLVGGCVRDMILGRTPKDWDISTAATPEQVMALFPDVRPTGIKFGTVTVMEGGQPYEVTTFRGESDYTDGRRPDTVTWAKTIWEDLSRRDFTVNALAYCVMSAARTGVAHALDDIQAKTLRAVGNPDERFSEDALRILRGIRFIAQLGFGVEEETAIAMRRHHRKLENVARERVYTELEKTLMGEHWQRAVWAFAPIVSSVLEVTVNSRRLIGYDPATPGARWAWVLGDCASPYEAQEVLRNLRAPRAVIDEVFNTIAVKQDLKEATSETTLRSALGRGKELGVDTEVALQLANLDVVSDFVVRKAMADNCPVTRADLAIKGADVVAAGYRGKDVGRVMEHALSFVLADPTNNDRDLLLKFIGKRPEDHAV